MLARQADNVVVAELLTYGRDGGWSHGYVPQSNDVAPVTVRVLIDGHWRTLHQYLDRRVLVGLISILVEDVGKFDDVAAAFAACLASETWKP